MFDLKERSESEFSSVPVPLPGRVMLFAGPGGAPTVRLPSGEILGFGLGSGQNQLIGEIKMWLLADAPKKWACCHGQVLNIKDYPEIGDLLKATWGGDGVTTFGLPDFRDRVLMSAGDNRELGSRGGSDKIALSPAHLPMHRHTSSIEIPVCSAVGDEDATPGDNKVFGVGAAYTTMSADTTLKPFNVASGTAGAGMPIDITPAHIVVNCIIFMGRE